MLEKKYYDGTQIHRIISEEVKDYDTIMKILKRFADEPSALGTNLAEVGTDYAGGMKEIEVDRCGQYDDSNERFWWNSQNPVAWMPLPEVYRGD